ncbi:hypothetical protein [Nocardia stercoris]|uniref:Uncharacterized protein n=1 Tax=Nocardia stercoris TaxID=2483361 RepID=A0A3M2L8I2_9NOCA|nr:hypothetical protein [Nocardia stercoris]RMI32235.1 hypothetical protein EBN03_14685 [Nocardia stercoris]
MAARKHRAPNPSLQRVGGVVAVGAVPVVLAVVGAGSAQAAPAAPTPQPSTAMTTTGTAPAGAADSQDALGAGDQAQAQVQATAPSPSTFHIGDVQFNAPSWLDAGLVNSVNQTATQAESAVDGVLDSIGMGRAHADGAAQNSGAEQNSGGATTDAATAAKSPAADQTMTSVTR